MEDCWRAIMMMLLDQNEGKTQLSKVAALSRTHRCLVTELTCWKRFCVLLGVKQKMLKPRARKFKTWYCVYVSALRNGSFCELCFQRVSSLPCCSVYVCFRCRGTESMKSVIRSWVNERAPTLRYMPAFIKWIHNQQGKFSDVYSLALNQRRRLADLRLPATVVDWRYGQLRLMLYEYLVLHITKEDAVITARLLTDGQLALQRGVNAALCRYTVSRRCHCGVSASIKCGACGNCCEAKCCRRHGTRKPLKCTPYTNPFSEDVIRLMFLSLDE